MHYDKKSFVRSIFLCGAILLPSLATAQTESERAASGESFVRAFLGNCALNAGNFDRIVTTADALEYSDLPEKLKPLFAPQNSLVEFSGYYIKSGDGAPFFLGVSKGNFKGRLFVNCTISNPYIETAEVVSALQKFADTGDPKSPSD